MAIERGSRFLPAFRFEQVFKRARRQFFESRIGWRENGERTVAAQRIAHAGRFHGLAERPETAVVGGVFMKRLHLDWFRACRSKAAETVTPADGGSAMLSAEMEWEVQRDRVAVTALRRSAH